MTKIGQCSSLLLSHHSLTFPNLTREQIRRMFLDLQLASEDVNEKQAAVDEQASALAEKETAIRNGSVFVFLTFNN